ncbi:hypothetical protein CM54_11885 [Staphylococcus sp. TE8]|nr:hypothetical protein CM54_11885 [Staphylococcus sp. TE8]
MLAIFVNFSISFLMLFVKQSLILSNRLQAVSKISLGLSLIVDHTHFLFVFHMCVLVLLQSKKI